MKNFSLHKPNEQKKTILDWTIKCTRVVLVYYDHFIFIVKDIVSLGVVFVCKLVFVCAFVAVAFGIGRIKKSYETSLRFCAIDAPKRKTGANIKWDEKNGPNARKWEKKDKVQQQRDDKSENEKGRWKKGQKMNCIMKSLRVISRTALLLGHQFHTIFAHIFLNFNWELLLRILFVVSTFFFLLTSFQLILFVCL